VRPHPRRRRAAVLLALAVAAGGLAASEVRSSVEEVEARVGSPVHVVVASEDIRGGTRLEPRSLDRMLAVREVPELFAPPDSLSSPDEALGLRLTGPLAAGSYVTVGDLETGAGPGTSGPVLARGERVVEIAVAGGAALGAAGPGTRVDVLVTTGEEPGTGRTYVALQSVELVDVRPADRGFEPAGAASAASAGALASLRVTLAQAVLLTAAQNFAREIRLLARSPEDRSRVGPTGVRAAEL
jgi:pilus assembly protein CpaB